MEDKTSTIEDVIQEVRDADSIAETPFSSLFHEARTTNTMYSTVSVQVRVIDGGKFETHPSPVKTRQGEHLRGTDAWDTIISLPVVPFMKTEIARNELVRRLERWKQNEQQKQYMAKTDPVKGMEF